MVADQFEANLRLSQRLSWAGIVVGGVAKVIRAPIVIAAIGAEHYGLWVTCLQIVGISLSYEYVIGAFVTTHISGISASDASARAAEHRRIEKFLRLYYVKFILVVGLLAALAIGVVLAFKPPPASMAEVAIVAVSTIVSCCAYLYITMYVAVLDGYGKIWVGRLGKLVYETTGLIFLIGALLLFKNVAMVAVALLLQTLVFGLLVRVLHDREVSHRQLGNSIVLPDMDFGEKLRRRTVTLILTQTATVIYLYSPVFVMPILANYTAVTGYSVAAQLMTVGTYVIAPVLTVYLSKLVHDLKAGELGDYLGLSYFCCVAIFSMYGLVLIWAKSIIDTWVGPGFYLGAAFVLVLVLISIFEILYQVLRPIALCFSNESIFDKLSWHLAVLYCLVAIPCFAMVLLWNGGLFLVLLPTFVVSALVLVRSLYRRISLAYPHRLFGHGVWAVGGYISIMLGSVISEGICGEQAMLPRVAMSILIVAFSIATLLHALGASGAFRIAEKLLGISR